MLTGGPAVATPEPLSPLATRLAVATTVLAIAVQQSVGQLSALGLLGLLVAVLETQAVLWGRSLWTGRTATRAVLACILAAAVALVVDPLMLAMRSPARAAAVLQATVTLAAAALALRANTESQRRILITLSILIGLIGTWTILALPVPGIDVLVFQRDAAEAILHGRNPYAMDFPDPYGAAASAAYYGPGVSVNGRLTFGFPYMPLSLWLALPGHLLGDARLSSLAAVLIAANCIGFARPSRGATIAAVLLLGTPLLPQMVYVGWTDTAVVLLAAITWFCQCRAPRLLPYAVGLLLASKQYMIIAVPVLVLLVPRPWSLPVLWRFTWRATAAACVVTLPLVLPDLDAFLHSAVWLQFRQPFRPDALSALAWLTPASPQQWMAVPFAFTGAAWLVILWRHRQAPVPFALALGIVMLVFFATNKQAFLNYYFLVVGCLCCAVASTDAAATPD